MADLVSTARAFLDANYFAVMADRTQFSDLPYPSTEFTGRTAIVTGANVGLGLEAARHFTRLGAAKVILGCRSIEKAEAAKADIEASTGRKGVVEIYQVDMLSFESVKQFCQRAESLERIDVLVENASIATGRFEESEGFERSITVNVLSTFLMALLLLPKLRKTAAHHNVTPRLSIVSSDAHLFAAFKEKKADNVFEPLRRRENMNHDRYNLSKLLQVLLARQLAQEMGPPGPVIVNLVNPSLCKTNLFRDMPVILGWIMAAILFVLARTAEMGSRTLVAAAFAGEETHGEYMSSCEVHPPGRFVLSEEGRRMQKKLFGELLDILEDVQPGISKNVKG